MAGREPEPLIATDYVIDELLTLLKVRGEYARAEALGGALLRENIAEIHWVTPDDVFAAVQLVLLAVDPVNVPRQAHR